MIDRTEWKREAKKILIKHLRKVEKELPGFFITPILWDLEELTFAVKCTKCYDKGFNTHFVQITWSGDFPGDRGGQEKPKVEFLFCGCAKGKRMRKEFMKDGKSPESRKQKLR